MGKNTKKRLPYVFYYFSCRVSTLEIGERWSFVTLAHWEIFSFRLKHMHKIMHINPRFRIDSIFACDSATVPDPPTNLTVVRGDSHVNVSFTPPGRNGGHSLEGFRISNHPPGGTSDVSVNTTIMRSGLRNGVNYSALFVLLPVWWWILLMPYVVRIAACMG